MSIFISYETGGLSIPTGYIVKEIKELFARVKIKKRL
jgi:hypothetical protein